LWLLGIVGLAVLEESGARIAAALKGQSPRLPVYMPTAARLRARPRLQQPMRARPRWRDAA
jgi:hypothetical protein